MSDEDMTPERLHKLIESAVNPKAHYRRNICRRLATQTYNQFGVEGLFDLLSGIDDAGRFQSVIIADRDEVDNYLFKECGIFDQDMFEKIQMTDEWDAFIQSVLDQSSVVLAEIIKQIVESEQ